MTDTIALRRSPPASRPIVERSAQLYGTVAALFFVLTGIVYLILGRPQVTHQDFWLIYDTALNRPWLYSTLLKYNGHSHIFPSQFWLTNLRLFHGNENILFFAGLTLQLISAGLLLAPILSDRTIDKTIMVAAILFIVFGIFWMGKGGINESGGFNCEYSLTLGGAALGFLGLGALQAKPKSVPLLLLTIFGGLLATFSFGTGLAVWPTLLLLGCCLRLRPSRLIAIALAGVLAAVIFSWLPSREAGAHELPTFHSSLFFAVSEYARYFFRLLGRPFSFAISAWTASGKFTPEPSTTLEAWVGAAGVVGTLFFVGKVLVSRSLKGGLAVSGYGLIIFNFVALALIAIGRAEHFRLIPQEIDAPRYVFWSILFWIGLVLVALRVATDNPGLRWPILFPILALPILFLPSHYQQAVRCRYAAITARAAAISLVDGVHDSAAISIISHQPKAVYHLSKQLRQKRLDMFAGGLQDWIGRNISQVFPRRHKLRFRAQCHVDGFVESENGSPAARVRGRLAMQGRNRPEIMVISDRAGVISGIVEAYPTNQIINQLLYGGKFPGTVLSGYILRYDPQMQYTLRSVDAGALSAEKIPVSGTPPKSNPRPPAQKPTQSRRVSLSVLAGILYPSPCTSLQTACLTLRGSIIP